jgi:hypothetical protein
VQFYSDEATLALIVAKFVAEGLQANDPGLVVATPDHLVAIESELRKTGVDVARLKQLGDIVMLDARETLDTFMVDGLPHSRMFNHVVGSVLSDIGRAHPGRTIRVYGEMVNVLWKDGHTAAAIRLETLWNELANSHDFRLLCGYSMGNFYKGAAIEEITAQHSHLVADSGDTIPISRVVA